MNNEPEKPDGNILLQIVTMPMPFGKYKGTLLCNLPVFYLEWFNHFGENLISHKQKKSSSQNLHVGNRDFNSFITK